MGLFGMFKKQFIDVIEWTEEGEGFLSYRFRMEDREIQNGASLTVRESQIALFVNEGQIADFFEAGTHILETKNLPVLTNLKNWDRMFQSPFKSDIYFLSTREMINQKWGTAAPITVRDKDFGPIRLRAHGTYSYKVKNPRVFFQKLVGTREVFLVEDLEGQLRSNILTSLASYFGGAAVAFLDMAANQSKFSETLKEALKGVFADYGLSLESFLVQSVSLPEELQAHLDKVSEMNMVGDIHKFTQFQAAETLSNTSSGMGGAGNALNSGVGMAAGLAMGQSLAKNLLGSGVEESSSRAGGSAEEDPLALINRLHDLFSKGILTQEEFDVKKAELLKKIK